MPKGGVYLALQKLYVVAGLVFLIGTVVYGVKTGDIWRGIYGSVASSVVVLFGYYTVYIRRKSNSAYDALSHIFYFNLVVVILSYYAGLEWGLPATEFRIGFSFGNFSDFFFNLIAVTDRFSNAWYVKFGISGGAFPFSYAIANIFATLMGWSAGITSIDPAKIDGVSKALYAVYLVIFSVPIVFVVLRSLRRAAWRFSALLFLAISYPVMFEVERGNFVLVSAALLSLALYAFLHERKNTAATLFGVLMAVKLLNIIFVFFIVRNLWRKLPYAAGSFIVVTIGSLIYLYGFHLQNWEIFLKAAYAIFGGDHTPHLTDADKMAGGVVGIEGYLVLVHSLFMGLTHNIVSQSHIFDLITMAIGAACLVLFYVTARNPRIGVADWADEIMVLLVVPILFHPAAAAYDLVLLIPPLAIMAGRPFGEYENVLYRYSGLFFLLSEGIVIGNVINYPNRPLITSITPMSFVVPFSLIGMLVTILSRGKFQDGRLAGWHGATVSATDSPHHHNGT